MDSEGGVSKSLYQGLTRNSETHCHSGLGQAFGKGGSKSLFFDNTSSSKKIFFSHILSLPEFFLDRVLHHYFVWLGIEFFSK